LSSDGSVEDSAHKGENPLQYFKLDDQVYLFESQPDGDNAYSLKEKRLIDSDGESLFSPEFINANYRSIGRMTLAFDDKGGFQFIQANGEVAGVGQYVKLGDTVIITIQADGPERENRVVINGNRIVDPDGVVFELVTQ